MTLQEFIFSVGDLISGMFGLLIGIALLVFLWGLARFIMNMSSEGKAEDGRNLMTWGLVALFVMVSVWGLVRFIQSNLGLSQFDL
jgi:hypothetical protein